MRVLITIAIILFAHSASADMTKVFEDSHVKGYVYKGNTEIFKGIFTVSTHVDVKSRMKKSKTSIDEDYVIDCNNNTYRTEKSITTYNGVSSEQYRWTEAETEIYEGFPLKLKEMVCDGNTSEKVEDCVHVKVKDEAHRKYLRVYYSNYNKTICE